MSTRAAFATKSRLVRQRLENILFHHHDTNNNGVITKNNKKIVSLSYEELKMAYLKRIQDLHPDKYYHHQNTTITTQQQYCNTTKQTLQSQMNTNTNTTTGCSNSKQDKRKMLKNEIEFRELQEAWTNYDAVMKQSRKINNNYNNERNTDSNFTMFGVGCSFSDNPQERQLRNEIMDQAGRGWFTAGSIPQQTITTNTITPNKQQQQQQISKQISLTDDELFIVIDHKVDSSSSSDKQQTLETRPKSLIDHMIKSQKKPPKTTS